MPFGNVFGAQHCPGTSYKSNWQRPPHLLLMQFSHSCSAHLAQVSDLLVQCIELSLDLIQLEASCMNECQSWLMSIQLAGW